MVILISGHQYGVVMPISRRDALTVAEALEGSEIARKVLRRKPHKAKQQWIAREMGLSGQNQVKGAIAALRWMALEDKGGR